MQGSGCRVARNPEGRMNHERNPYQDGEEEEEEEEEDDDEEDSADTAEQEEERAINGTVWTQMMVHFHCFDWLWQCT